MKEKLVSIIIANWNGGEIFENCLATLADLDYKNWELVVVDNASTDGSQTLPNNFPSLVSKFRLIQNSKNIGFSVANNQGYDLAKGSYILLLNNDTIVAKDLLTKLVEKFESDESIGVLQPKIYIMDKRKYLDNAGSFITWTGFWHHWGFLQKDSKEFDREREIFSAKGACMLIRREVIEKVGLFDREFVSYFEETDFCWRAWLAGFRVLYYPKTHIYHKVGFTIRRQNVLNINFHYYKNRIASQIKNLSAINLFLILLPHLIVSLGIMTVFVLRGNTSNAKMILSAIVWNIKNKSKLLKKRKLVQGFRKISDQELFAKLMVPINWGKFLGDFKRIEEDIERKKVN